MYRRESSRTRSQTQLLSQSQALTISHQAVPTVSESISDKIKAYFVALGQPYSDYSKSEYLYTSHELNNEKLSNENQNDSQINRSDFIPEPKSLNQVIRLSSFPKEKCGTAISKEVYGLFDNDTFGLGEGLLPTDEIVPVKLALKAKLNAYGGLDKLRARICLRGDMPVKDGTNTWSPTASSRLLK